MAYSFEYHKILLKLTLRSWKLLTYGIANLRLVGSQVETLRVVNLQPVGLQVATRWLIAMWLTCNSLARDSPFVGLQFSNTLRKYINPRKTGLFEGSFLLARSVWCDCHYEPVKSYPWVNYTKLIFSAAMLKTLQNEICASALLTKNTTYIKVKEKE